MNHVPRGGKELEHAVRKRRERRKQSESDGERSLGRNFAVMGMLGWTIVVPTLLGLFAGRWLDQRYDTGIQFTAGLLVLGVAVGCYLAWRRIQRE